VRKAARDLLAFRRLNKLATVETYRFSATFLVTITNCTVQYF